MIQITAYLRTEEDYKKWKSLFNKVEWLHSALNDDFLPVKNILPLLEAANFKDENTIEQLREYLNGLTKNPSPKLSKAPRPSDEPPTRTTKVEQKPAETPTERANRLLSEERRRRMGLDT